MRVRLLVAVCVCACVAYYTPLANSPGEVERRNEYFEALQKINFDDVKKDLTKLFTESQDWWPADYGNYGPFFVRLAWHCAGSYRTSDGRGGCSGGRQRFDPERSWADNTNLDKARKLLGPIREKYGIGLSWGDLFILAGTTAMESMGFEPLGFCAGRIDQVDGSQSTDLGSTPTGVTPDGLNNCTTPGDCQRPFGTTTVGLIYVNPEGPQGVPDPDVSFKQIRDTFGRMSMNDTETVALIGGGHSFGKTHGACPTPPGPAPDQAPLDPWKGNCGNGVGVNAFTSGFEGPWTTTPNKFDNQYFRNLINFNWSVAIGPGGHNQWHITNPNPPQIPYANGTGLQNLMMLTSDVSLLHDPEYKAIVQQWATDEAAFANAFKHAWYKLTTRDMGPVTRCYGTATPPAQPFQYPLPPPPAALASADDVRADIRHFMSAANANVTADMVNGAPYYGAMFVKLAWQCASTFRVTDHQGGCNGARIRYPPQSTWAENANMDKVLEVLQPIKTKYGSSLSWADLIVLAATTALEDAGAPKYDFCPGRTDATDGQGSENLKMREFALADAAKGLRYRQQLLDMSDHEIVVLQSRPRSPVLLAGAGLGTWTHQSNSLSNEYFKVLLSYTWVQDGTKAQYKAQGSDVYMQADDIALLLDADFATIVQDFAYDNALYLKHFAAAWNKLVISDRYDGPVKNLCSSTAPPSGDSSGPPVYEVVLVSIACTCLALACLFSIFRYFQKKSANDGYSAM